jgi:dihydrofolate synthase/folylpolyglutamate synthase
MPATLLSKRAKEFGLKGKAYPTVEAALENALENASDFDALLVTGSIFIVGEVLSINVKK